MTEERKRLMAEAGISLVLDVGANEGQYATALRAGGYDGRIISFEPLRDEYERLQRSAGDDPGWETKNFALGADTARATMHVSGNSYSSSFLPVTCLCVEAAPEASYVRVEEVQVVSLDSLDVPEGVEILLKADVQGYEPHVIRGATRLLARVALLELELSLVPLYAGQELAHDVCALVRRAGFVPVALGNPFRHPATQEILSIDGLFRRVG